MSHKSYRSYVTGGLLILVPLCGIFLFPNFVWAQIQADHLVISEIQTSGGPGLTANDFIEIFNPTSSPVDLSGYRLVKRTQTGTADSPIKSWTTSTIIPAKGFYLWANSGFTALAADATTSFEIADNNAVALRFGPADTGTVIDAVAWGSNASGLAETAPFASNIPAGQSLERVADTNNNSADFVIQTVPTPKNLASGPEVPAARPTPVVQPAPPRIFISEVLPDPEGKDRGLEWVELFNAGSDGADVSGWILDDEGASGPGSTAWTLSGFIEAGSYKAFYMPSGRFALNNDADSVRLFDAAEKLADQIAYKDSEEGLSFAKNSSGVWSWTQIPTPGTANQFSADEGGKSAPVFDHKIIFNEIFGNAKGADAGKEWLELANAGAKDADLSGWYIDDQGKTLSKNAFRLPSGSVIAPGGLLLVNLPARSFTITNSEEEIRLITPSGDDFVSVFTPEFEEENLSFARKSLDGEDWEFSFVPTPGEANKFASPEQKVNLSEIYFLNGADTDPFLEIENSEGRFVGLGGWKISAGGGDYAFPEGASIAPKSFLILNFDETNLNVSKDNYLAIVFSRPDGAVQNDLSQLTATGTAKSGWSVVLGEGKAVWSSAPTPGQKNKTPKISAAIKPSVKIVSPAPKVEATPPPPPVVEGANTELPIIIEEKSNRGFLGKILASFKGWLLK